MLDLFIVNVIDEFIMDKNKARRGDSFIGNIVTISS